MKIQCHCGALILDSSDSLPQKAHLIPDQVWFTILDAIDESILAPLESGRINEDGAAFRIRELLGKHLRTLWQCRSCGRLYCDDGLGHLHSYVPENAATSHEILKATHSR